MRMKDFCTGMLQIRLTGSNAERFLNLCEYQGICLEQIVKQGSSYSAVIHAKDFFRLSPIIKKTGVRPVITEKKGLPFWLKRNRKRKILVLCALLFAGLIYYLSGFLWRIEFSGCYYHTKEQLADFMAETGVFEGARKTQVSCQGVEEAIRRQFPDIGWVSAELSGTVMKVRIQETKMPSLNAQTITDGKGNLWQEESGHIVAEKDGIVAEITVSQGKALVHAGDVVRKGDILISGVMEVIGDNELLVERYPVLAQGKVRLKTLEKYTDDFSMEYMQKVYTGREKTGVRLECISKKIFSYNPSNSYSDCDIITEMEQYCIGDSFFLPIKLFKTTIREYEEKPCRYSEEEAAILADERLVRYLEECKRQGAVILSAETETSFGENLCHTESVLKCLESAWQYRSINPDEWRLSEKDEHNTDGD